MNNQRLLVGLLAAASLSGGVCARSQGRQVLSMERLFDLADANSAQLRPTVSAEDEVRREISVARSGRLPDIEVGLSVSYLADGFTTDRRLADRQPAPIPHLGNGLELQITQPLYTGGAVTASIQMAQLKSTAARFATELQRHSVRFSLAGYYLDIYKCTNLRGVVEQNLARARQVLAEMKARHTQGVALLNDITRYELLVSNLELQLIKLDNTLRILNNHLVVTAGLPDSTEIVPDSTILQRSLPGHGEQWWQQQAQTHAPQLLLAQTAIDISRKAESLARSERLPKVGLKAGWSIDGPILVEVPPINRNLSYWYVGLGVSYNLASLYKGNKALARSRAATHTARSRYEAEADRLSMDVNADYLRYLEAYEELKTRQKSVELAERNYRTVVTRYGADMALITDLLDAANSKLDAEQQLVNARINIIYYYCKLLFITGKI